MNFNHCMRGIIGVGLLVIGIESTVYTVESSPSVPEVSPLSSEVERENLMGPNEAKSYGSHVALGMVLIILTACGLAWKTETDAIKRLSPNNVDDIVRRYRIARRRELNIGNEALPATTGFLNHHA